jgi:enoyl-[acyl-carrier protein] reductase II
MAQLKRRVRASRNAASNGERRQSAAGQIAGMIHDVVPVRDLIEDMLAKAARLAERMPVAARG